MTQLKMRQNGSDRIWTLSYGLDTGINFLLYVVHFELMLWSASYVLDRWHGSLSEAGMASGIFIVGALAARIPLTRALPLLALFGAAHGWAHGAEGPSTGLIAFAAGFAGMTAALHGLGLGLGLALQRLAGMRLTRLAGGVTAAAGLALAIGG